MSPDENFTSDAARRTLAAALAAAQASGRNVGRGRASRPRPNGSYPGNTGSAGDARNPGDSGTPGNGTHPGPRGVSGTAGSAGFADSPGMSPRRGRASRGQRGAGSASTGRYRRYSWTGSGPDEWDPQLLTSLIADTVKKHGWQAEVTGGRIINNWPDIMGEEIASHSHVEKLDEDGILHIRTDTTAWATQLRLLQPQILAELGKRYGSTVRMLRILGPNRPSWRKGPKHVKGRGPRDTYG